MKKVFRFLSLGTLAVAFTAAGAVNSNAQDACADVTAQQAQYKIFTDNYAGTTVQARETALNAAKGYVEKYGACPEAKQQIDYFKAYIPKAETDLDTMRKGVAAEEEGKKRAAIYARFNDGLKNKNWDEVYAAGKELLPGEKNPKTALDITIVLGTVGFNETVSPAKNEKYNADTLKYAADAIKKIEGGQVSDAYGIKSGNTFVGYSKKDEALGSLNYIIGYLTYNTGAKDQKAALPYLYKSTQYDSTFKKLPDAYQGIGAYYFNEIVKLENERQEKLKASAGKDTDETKAIFAMQRGYAERSLDAYSKAYQMTDAAKEKARKDAIYANIKVAYDARTAGKGEPLSPTYISGLAAKPLTDPKTEVTPIVEAPAETTAPATDASSSTTPAATTAPATTTKPATTTTTKPAATTTKPAATTTTKPADTTKPATSSTTATTNTNTNTAAPVKKPAPKKKGTR